MSIHLMVVAAYLPPDLVTQGQKLALMKICDSADDETRLARPGMKRLRAWVGVSEKRCTTIVTELVGLGLVERVQVGRAGRAAVYRVFPLGVPPIPSTEELGARHRAADEAPKNAKKARLPKEPRVKPSAPARTYRDIEEKERPAPPQMPEDSRAGGAGSDGKAGQQPTDRAPGQEEQASGSTEEAGFHRWNPENDEDRVPPVKPTGFHGGNPGGFTGETPSFLSSSSFLPSPPPPGADAVKEAPDRGRGCSRHPVPAASCRSCGTSPRAVRAAEERARLEEARQVERRKLDALKSEQEENRRRASERPDRIVSARQKAREAVQEWRELVREREGRSRRGSP
ncbi:hypothetical protein ACFC0K_15950 [Streptomyces hydrogenans]|uniref:hypothetical protein n=1 Tax=Streptomyces hydrogenans TaxID=1873719 RepID=UPI0035DCA891